MRLESTSLAALLVALTACGPASAPAPQPAQPGLQHPDKRSLYADAGLIPTREGERARRELALAGEIHGALALLDLAPAHVDVELGADTPSVAIVAQADPSADLELLEAAAADLAAASVPDLRRDAVRVWLRPRSTPPAPPRRRPPWALALTCLGLGLSLGVTLERLRALRRSRTEHRF